jgi:hypothetical protein
MTETKLFQFESNNCGITGSLNEDSPLDLFKLFFDQKLIQIIVDEIDFEFLLLERILDYIDV